MHQVHLTCHRSLSTVTKVSWLFSFMMWQRNAGCYPRGLFIAAAIYSGIRFVAMVIQWSLGVHLCLHSHRWNPNDDIYCYFLLRSSVMFSECYFMNTECVHEFRANLQYRNVIPSRFISYENNNFLTLAGSGILPNMIRAVNQSQFTPKMKANAVSRLLSSLVWIDHYILCNQLTALMIFGKIHFLLISGNQFFHKIKRDGITSLHGIHLKVVEW